MKLTLVSRSGKELLPGGIDLPVRTDALLPRGAASPGSRGAL
jgi:hypothetical protein